MTTAIILLLVGVLAILVMRRLRLSPIVGYFLAGIIIGPHALGLVQESETTHLLAELGVVFLLFDIGLHFTLSSLWEARRDIFGLGPLQLILCGLVFGFGLIAFGMTPEYALLVGGALALSSTAVVVPTIAERGQQNCPVGLTSLAILIFQDIFAIFLLVFATSLETSNTVASSELITTITMAMIKTAVAFLAALLIGQYAIRPLFHLLSQTKNEEVFTAMALLVVLAAAMATNVAALSLTLGAFLGGMIIAETPFRHIIQTEAKPFRNLLLGFFFMTVGMSLDWRLLVTHGFDILLFLALFTTIKIIVFSLAARTVGWSTPGSAQLGFLLAQGSEFVFVILAMPAIKNALDESVFGILITGVAVSLALTPSLAALGNHVAQLIKRRYIVNVPGSETTPGIHTAPVILFGLDNVGRTIADALEAHAIPYDAIESDYERFLAASADGYPVAFGALGDLRLMETLTYAERELIVVTIGSYELAQTLTPTMHQRYPNLPCFIAVETEAELKRFEALGISAVVNRSIPAGLDMAAVILRHLRIEEDRIHAWMQRQQERALLAQRHGPTRPADKITSAVGDS